MECLAIGPQHINRGDDHSPKRKHRRDLEDVKPIHLPAILERTKKDHDFPGKVRKTRQADRSKYAEAKSEAGKGHHFSKAAQLIKNQRSGRFRSFLPRQTAGQSKGHEQTSEQLRPSWRE